MNDELQRLAQRVAAELGAKNRHVVFAESCTGGLVAASLAQIPGISRHLAGSLVVYQDATKQAWLGMPPSVLKQRGAVSRTVAVQMATEALRRTPHASLAASITGHLGPDAPPRLDGTVYLAVSSRDQDRDELRTSVKRHTLKKGTRKARQREAAALVLLTMLQTLELES